MKITKTPIFFHENMYQYVTGEEKSESSHSEKNVTLQKYIKYNFDDSSVSRCFTNKRVKEQIINKEHFDHNDLKSNEMVVQAQLDTLPTTLNDLLKITDINQSSNQEFQIVRRVVTLLTGITFSKSDNIGNQARAFLEKSINGKTFKSFGNEENIQLNDLKLIQEETIRIKEWINKLN